MSAPTAAVGLRIIASRARALGPGDADSLQNVDTTKLPDGSACWVSDIQAMYVLDHAASSGGSNITPINGPGFWTPLSSGTGGGIPMPDGTVAVPRGANFLNELGLGIYRPAAGKIGVASGNFLGMTMGNGTATNVDPLSPSVVRYVMQGFNRPLTGGENETTFAYVLIDPSVGQPQQAALYVDITSNQLDTYGPAIKIVHAGRGDAIYVAQFNDGSAYEAASFFNGSRGYISTIQVAGCANSTLFNGLWGDATTVPNFGMLYLDESNGNAITIRRLDSANPGQTQVRLIEQVSERVRFSVDTDGSVMLQGEVATNAEGGVDHASPELRLYGSVWDTGAATAKVNGFIVKSIPNGADNASILGFYNSTPLGVALIAQLTNDNVDPTDARFYVGSTGAGQIRAKQFISPGVVDLVANGGNLALRCDTDPNVDDTYLEITVNEAVGGDTLKHVAQGAPDSAGVGFRSLVVPNDSEDDTSVGVGDFAIVGWGTDPTPTVDAGSTCRRGTIEIATGSGSTSAAWTLTLTFPVAFDAAPFAVCEDNSSPLTNGIAAPRVQTISATTLVIQGRGDDGPLVGGSVYRITWMVME